MRTTRMVHFLWTMVCMVSFGCENPSNPEPVVGEGAAVINVSASALSVADIARIVVILSGDGISPDIIIELTEYPEDSWYGVINNIPAGDDRTFMAEAYDDTDTLVYLGAAAGVAVEDGVTISVTIQLQQVDPPPSFDNAVPVITAFVVSPMTVGLGEDVTLSVTASDANPEDILTYRWTGTGGIFSNTTLPSAVWTAPGTSGTYTVKIAVTDPKGAVAELSADIIAGLGSSGTAEIQIAVNSSPTVTGLIPTPSRIDKGESTKLDLTAQDPEGDPLDFIWKADCGGVFDDNRREDPVFTLDELTDGTCVLTVSIRDGNGGSNQASITIQTGPAVTPSDIPAGCSGVIEFPDAALEAIVRREIGMPTGDIYYDDVKGVTSLSPRNADIFDITGLQCLTGLMSLNLRSNAISDISPLSSLINLTEINLRSNRISDVSPLSGLVNLVEINLWFNRISDISAFSGLVNLKELHLTWNNISDISALSNLVKLTSLELSSNDVSDISPLSGLINLTELDLDSNNVSDISPLSKLKNLTYLRMTYNDIDDIPPLPGLGSLTSLWLDSNNISDISAFSDLVNLEELSIYSNNINDISALSGLVSLTDLNLSGNDISDISALSGLIKLTDLSLSGNNIRDISSLSGLMNLTRLYMERNDIRDIEALSDLDNLTFLWLQSNNISDISTLSGLVKLTNLALSSNDISDISVLSNLVNLIRLELYDNNISDISPLADLVNLRSIELYLNDISDISPLSNLVNLSLLWLYNNDINDITPLAKNPGIGERDNVRLYNLPLDCEDEATQETIEILEDRGVNLEHSCE